MTSRPRTAVLLLALITAAACNDGPEGPAIPTGALQFSVLSAGYFQTCGLATDGRAFCWGMNDFGTLGDGTRATHARPTLVFTTEHFTMLDSGAGHTCALTSDGKAFCWGRNDEGQVGDGTFQDVLTPVAVATSLRFQSISAGHAHSCALTTAGVAYCWGDDIRGQLGDGPNAVGVTKSALPVRVNIASLTSVVAGYYQTCGLDNTGKAYCWGANDYGQSGDGTTANHDEPVAVQGTRTYSMVAPGDRFVCAVSSGSVFCWGANRFGELGTTGIASSTQPVQVAGLSNVITVSTSMGASTVGSAQAYACAIKQSAQPVCWGGNIATLRAQNATPSTLSDALNASGLALGSRHACVLTNAHYAFCGGTNTSGQLGDGSTVDRAQLVPTVSPFAPD